MSEKLQKIKEKWSNLKQRIEQTDNKKLYQFTKELNDALIGNINITVSISNIISQLENDLNEFEKFINENFDPNNNNNLIQELIGTLNKRKEALNNINDKQIKESINNELEKITALKS